MVDWRANRLVDILAKKGTAAHVPNDDVVALLKSATVLTRHLAAQLGETTFIANNFKSEVQLEDGSWMTKVLRDSMAKPRCGPDLAESRADLAESRADLAERRSTLEST